MASPDLDGRLRDLLSKAKTMKFGWSDEVDKLVAEGADPNVCDDGDQPALCVVAQEGYPRTVKHLMDAGANVNAQTPAGRTALYAAVIHRRIPIVESMLKHQRSVEIKHDVVLAALDAALQSQYPGVIKPLLLFLDTLKSERYRHVSAIQVGGLFGVVVESGDYAHSVVNVIESFVKESLGWSVASANEVRHCYDHQVQDVTWVSIFANPGDEQKAMVGHLLHNIRSSDYGMGTECSHSLGGVLIVPLRDRALAESAGQLIQLVRQIDQEIAKRT